MPTVRTALRRSLLVGFVGTLASCGRRPPDRPTQARDSAPVEIAPAHQPTDTGGLKASDFALGGLSDESDSATVIRILGRPDSITREANPFDSSGVLSTWHYADVVVTYIHTDTVFSLVVSGPRLATARGVRVGDPVERIVKAYGAPASNSDGDWIYEDPKEELHQLSFLVRDGRVARIVVGTVLD